LNPANLSSFVPFFRNAHLSTIASNFWKRPISDVHFPVTRRVYRTAPDIQVGVDEQSPPDPVAPVLGIHGLEGSSNSGYLLSLSHELLNAGYAVHRFNMRSCGGTENLASSNYHAGQTSDVLSVLRQIRQNWTGPLFLIGFSLGGNVSLKLAGELGQDAIGFLDGVCSVSNPLDLAACSDSLEEPRNVIYENRFLKYLRARINRRHLQYPDIYDIRPLAQIRTIRQFDDTYTAKLFGFGTAANYFATQSSNQFLELIRIPTLMIQAKDDPLIPFRVYSHPAIQSNPNLRLMATDHGGHVGFIAQRQPRFWIDPFIHRWTEEIRNKTTRSTVIIP
jgi:predicted alpha/beta-fold hydrolase